MSKYAVAYCENNGLTFSDTEPYIEDAGSSIKDIEDTLQVLVKKRMRTINTV